MAIQALHHQCFRLMEGPRSVGICSQSASPLSEKNARAVATLLPLLGCGEEAASFAFDDIADHFTKAHERYALHGIALEERVHDDIIQELIATMPVRPDVSEMLKSAKHFHVKLGRGTPAERLARIAALDAAVCLILSRLTRARAPITTDSFITSHLIRIRNDEARHVSVSRALAIAVLPRAELDDLGAAIRWAFADVLMLGAGALETLGVDPWALARDIRALPNGLFRA